MIEIVHYQVNDLVNMLKKPCDPREAASLMCPSLRRVNWMSAQVLRKDDTDVSQLARYMPLGYLEGDHGLSCPMSKYFHTLDLMV